MFLVFLRSDGSYYKAMAAKSPSDSHIPHVLDDLRDTLPDDSSLMTWTEVKAAMNAKNPEKPQRLFP